MRTTGCRSTPGWNLIPMWIPAARHPEFGPAAVSGAKGMQQGLDLAAQMGFHTHAATFQGQPQRLGNGRAEQHVHAKLCHATRQGIGRQRAQDELLSTHFAVALLPHHQQAGRGVEHRRNTVLPDRNSHGHSAALCSCRASRAPPRLRWGQRMAAMPAERGLKAGQDAAYGEPSCLLQHASGS